MIFYGQFRPQIFSSLKQKKSSKSSKAKNYHFFSIWFFKKENNLPNSEK